MTPTATRLMKETRQIFWPWLLAMCLGALAWTNPTHDDYSFALAAVATAFGRGGFFLGIPLLCALSLGSEFQYRTVGLLMSQPISRRQLWIEKSFVLTCAVVSIGLVYRFGWFLRDPEPIGELFGAVLLVTFLTSTTFWTLLSRSTIGGLVLTGMQSAVSIWVGVVAALFFVRMTSVAAFELAIAYGVFALLLVSVLFLWLSYRSLNRFQFSGTSVGADLAGLDTRLGFITSWLRARNNSPTINLIRKEIRMLMPVWVLLPLAVVALLLVRSIDLFLPNYTVVNTGVGVTGVFLVMANLLAGSLSLGEERTSGTLSWHMTLPISVTRQWLVKISSALMASLVFNVLCLAAGRAIFGSEFLKSWDLFDRDVWGLLLWTGSWTFAAFWAASTVKGTVKAIVWVFPAFGILIFTGSLTNIFPIWQIPGFDRLVLWLHPYPYSWWGDSWAYQFYRNAQTPVVMVLPAIGVMLIQTIRLLRRELRDDSRSGVRYLASALAITLAWSVLGATPRSFHVAADFQVWSSLSELSQAVNAFNPGDEKLIEGRPLQITLDELSKTSTISASTRQWLPDPVVTVIPKPFTRHLWVSGHFEKQGFRYYSSVHLRGGWDCSFYGSSRSFLNRNCTTPAGGRWGYWSDPDKPDFREP